jgi:carboxyl-terminal processing protease
MSKGSVKTVKLWRVMLIAVVCWAVFACISRDLSADNQDTYKSLKIFSEVLDIIKNNYVEEVEDRDLIEKAIQGMVQSLDPHSAFLTPDAMKELQVDTQGEFGGIGIEIHMPDGILTVVAPIDGTPAAEAGIQAGDKIIKVDGELTKDMGLLEAVSKMRGPKGTEVTITIWRAGEPEPIDFELIRDTIPIDSIRSALIQEGFGYVRITNFQEKTTPDLTDALETLEDGAVPLKGLVLDLRNNPGGLLDQSVSVADLFLEHGTIVSMKGRDERDQRVFSAIPNKVKRDYPIVVLINNGSASASEIVAGALQDHKRALILGTTSFGKGSVQNVEALRDDYGLKLTIARYYTPSGNSIQAQGIEPDIEVEQRTLDEIQTDKKNGLIIKEKDLKNHLEAEPNGDEEKDSDEIEEDEESGDEDSGDEDQAEEEDTSVRSSRSPIDPEDLKKDWQVVRALEILVGYDIFKGISQ